MDMDPKRENVGCSQGRAPPPPTHSWKKTFFQYCSILRISKKQTDRYRQTDRSWIIYIDCIPNHEPNSKPFHSCTTIPEVSYTQQLSSVNELSSCPTHLRATYKTCGWNSSRICIVFLNICHFQLMLYELFPHMNKWQNDFICIASIYG